MPKARSLASALNSKPPGTTRVVCQPDSLKLLNASIAAARKHGYDIRPTDHRRFGKKAARKLRAINAKLFKRCRFHEIQPAVTASHNNDRVVVMPGLYTEPTSRAQADQRPGLRQRTRSTTALRRGAVSYAYQFALPQRPEPDRRPRPRRGRRARIPSPPLEDRHDIPNLGPCIRCNLQLEGSGVSADDVIVDAGNIASGNGGRRSARSRTSASAPTAPTGSSSQHDRPPRQGARHLRARVRRLPARPLQDLLGGRVRRADVRRGPRPDPELRRRGHGDSGLYPGAGADTGAERDDKYYPELRYSQEIRYCDSHHNLAGYSGTDGNATHVDHNNFYDNALGFTTDVFTAPGHPGFPQDSDLVEYNNFYSNNFNVYDAEVGHQQPLEPEPVGTGLWIAGGNDNVVRFNHFYDNWRRGTMLFAAPDATICGPAIGTPVTGCDPSKVSTSYDNRFYGNVMGSRPTARSMPNGTDFWWDSFPDNTGNCWYRNQPAPGAAITTSPQLAARLRDGKDPSSSMGTGDAANEGELAGCLLAIESGQGYNPELCPWFTVPPKPGSSGPGRASSRRRGASARRSWTTARATRPPPRACRSCGRWGDCEGRADRGGAERRGLLAGAVAGAAPPGSQGPADPAGDVQLRPVEAARADIQQTVIDELHGFYGGPVSGQRAPRPTGRC